MRLKLLVNASIVIKYRWIRYKKNKQKATKKKTGATKKSSINARFDSGLTSFSRRSMKRSNDYNTSSTDVNKQIASDSGGK